jgi:hypothetical protein
MNVKHLADRAALEHKGYVVVPGFLSADEVAALAQDFFAVPWLDRHRYVFKHMSRPLLERFRPKIQALAEQARQRRTVVLNGFYFATKVALNGTTQDQVFSFHQDRESYYLWQTHAEYLNFYIPLVKPVRDRSNLTVLPFDRLRQHCPTAWAKLLGKGAHMVEDRGGGTTIIDESIDGNDLTVDVALRELAETPPLEPGDLLLLRGDVVHKTQDAETDRVAISFRTIAPDLPLVRSKLAIGGVMKYQSMIKNHGMYHSVLDAFDLAGKTEMTSGEFLPIYERLRSEAAGAPARSIPKFLASLTRDLAE